MHDYSETEMLLPNYTLTKTYYNKCICKLKFYQLELYIGATHPTPPMHIFILVLIQAPFPLELLIG